MILLNISYSQTVERMLAKELLYAAKRLKLPEPTVKTASVITNIIMDNIKAKKDVILITDAKKYATRNDKVSFCYGEVSKMGGYNNFAIFAPLTTLDFFSPQAKLKLMHLCEKAVLMTYHLLPSFNFLYKPITEQEEMRTLISYFRSNSNVEFNIACDIETSNKLITCISYTFQPTEKSVPLSICVDLIGFSKGIRIDSSNIDYYISWIKLLKELHSLPNLRWIFHNGTYDNSYLLKYNAPTLNYHYDNQYFFFCMHSLSRKALYHVTSAVSPMYKYWKQEIKGGEDSDTETKESSMPHTVNGYQRYLRYCALDSFFTWTDFMYCVQLCSTEMGGFYRAALNNYGQIQRLNIIYMEMQFNSFPIDQKYLMDLLEKKAKIAAYHKNYLEYAFSPAIPEFNINSIATKQKIFYDILKATPVGGTKSTNADTLAQLAGQHPLIEYIGNHIRAYQENHKFVSDFKKLLLVKNIQCKLNATGTITSRANSKETDFNKGRNLQNITAETREAFIAPQNYLVADIDYSQADTYFVASTVDQHMFDVVTDDRDTHAVHASQVFGVPYEQVLATKGEKHSVRKLVKPISHGGNYFMTARTMYVKLLKEIGSEGLMQMADNLHYPRPSSPSEFIKMCDKALQKYRAQYAGLVQWGNVLYTEQYKNNGWIKTPFNFTTLFPVMQSADKVDNIQREIAAYKGQGGTSGLMNRFLVNLYYNGWSKCFDGKDHYDISNELTKAINNKDIIPIVQVHDSIVFFIRQNKFDLLAKVMSLMETDIEYNGHKFHVPVECEVGRFWSKRLMRVFNPKKVLDVNKFIEDLPKLADRYK